MSWPTFTSATLPLRYEVDGLLAGSQAGVAAIARSRPAVRERMAGLLGKALPGSGFGPKGERLEGWRWRMRVDATTTGITTTVRWSKGEDIGAACGQLREQATAVGAGAS